MSNTAQRSEKLCHFLSAALWRRKICSNWLQPLIGRVFVTESTFKRPGKREDQAWPRSLCTLTRTLICLTLQFERRSGYCHVMMNLFRSDRFMPINKRGYRETFSIKNFHWNWYHTTCTSILAMSWYWCLQYSYSILLWKCYYCQLKLKLLIIVFVT